MKIIEINTTKNSGSTGRIATQIQKYVNDKGDLCKIAFGYGNGEDKAAFSMYSWVGTHIHSFLSRKLCMQGRCSWFQTYRLVKFLKIEKPDIVHLHNIHGHYLNYKILFRYLKSIQIPVIWTFHDCWAFTGKCAHYSMVNCMKWKTGCFSCPNLNTYPDSEYDASRRNFNLKRKYFDSIDSLYIVTVSDWLQTQVQQSFLADKYIMRIYNGVDTDLFKPTNPNTIRRKLSIPENSFVVLGVSSVWKNEKGFNKFLEVANVLKDVCEFVMVGLTNEQIDSLPPHIHGICRTDSQAELGEIYSGSDILLNPSTEETFGMVSIEAMACGTPVVVSNETACSEVVIDERVGIVADMNRIDQITEAILKVRSIGKSSYSEICRKTAVERFSLQAMQNNYYQLYNKICNKTI